MYLQEPSARLAQPTEHKPEPTLRTDIADSVNKGGDILHTKLGSPVASAGVLSHHLGVPAGRVRLQKAGWPQIGRDQLFFARFIMPIHFIAGAVSLLDLCAMGWGKLATPEVQVA